MRERHSGRELTVGSCCSVLGKRIEGRCCGGGKAQGLLVGGLSPRPLTTSEQAEEGALISLKMAQGVRRRPDKYRAEKNRVPQRGGGGEGRCLGGC